MVVQLLLFAQWVGFGTVTAVKWLNATFTTSLVKRSMGCGLVGGHGAHMRSLGSRSDTRVPYFCYSYSFDN